MSEIFVIKRNDLLPPLGFTLLDGETPVDMSAATSARLIMRNMAGIKINRAVTFLDQDVEENHGKGSFTWEEGDTDTTGRYKAEIEVIWPEGPQTFPADTYFQVKIVSDLDDVPIP